jgi:hypothetical protein
MQTDTSNTGKHLGRHQQVGTVSITAAQVRRWAAFDSATEQIMHIHVS